MVLGQEVDVLRPIALNSLKGCLVGSEEEFFLGLGSEVVGTTREDDSNEPESSISISRAPEESLIGKDR